MPRLRTWLALPEVARFFSEEHGEWIASLLREPIPAHPFVITYDGAPIGVIVWEYLVDFPDVAELYGVSDRGTINCDIFIGEASFLHRGLGGAAVERFLGELAGRESRVTRCVIDPVVENTSAIRAYEKAGFRWIRNAPDGEGETVYLMEKVLAP